jgi:hypothetical protein
MIATAELELQRQLTLAFIAADSFSVTLMRSTLTANNSGGYKRSAPTPLAPQTMRLIPSQDGSIERLTADGVAVSPSYMLMGRWDADMRRWDRFTLGGAEYEVVFINQNTQYETKGEVAYLGD